MPVSYTHLDVYKRQEQGVSAVQSRDREQVHHREDDGQEGGLEPEVMPVPVSYTHLDVYKRQP